ncbi:MAG: MFS transporter [Bacteroidetes bacterium]|nr:MFS transporter [Bacteroidota bacterium]
MNTKEIQLKKNFRYHIIEGMLYIGTTTTLISTQTTMPALIKRLGGSNVLVGSWPVVMYLAYFLPQLISANRSSAIQFRKPFVIRLGFIQRLHILILAFIIALWGETMPALAIAFLFLIFISNQMVSGTVSPVWMDFLVKTIPPESRGKLVGWRASLAATLGLVNGFILTILLTMFSFPYNYAAAIGLAFLYQMGSLKAQKKVVEDHPSAVSEPVHISELFKRMRSIISSSRTFKKFLIASSLLTVSFTSAAFFTVAAMKRFDLSASSVGIFTVVMIIGQILSGVMLGWIADAKGTRAALIICGTSLLCAIAIALFAPSVIWFYPVFIFLGVVIGGETFMRYNFAVECAQDGDRAMYVGVMNTWLAPVYLLSPLAGWLSTEYGYNVIFWLSLVIGGTGLILLARMPDPRLQKLALSSK